MFIGGLQKFSLIDYPNKLASLIFTQGCQFLCHYCHNASLISKKNIFSISEEEVLAFLKTRQGKLDSVVITGGEPTLQIDLKAFIEKIKNLNFLVKLDTNGTNPKVIKDLLNNSLVDYIAMDIKAPLDKYFFVTQRRVNIKNLQDTINLILNSNIEYEFRTTVVDSLLSLEDVEEIAKTIKGSKLFFLQKFIATKTFNPLFNKEKPFTEKKLEEAKLIAQKYVKKCFIR